ncbi:MAG: cytochrome c oxidase subunit II [Ignavibacteriales bacterium]|nr:cytochrome c oxidase subunit II [Ignavibacteriales bacterium]
MSPAPTQHVETVDFIMIYIVAISVVLLLGITAAMIYFVFKYHRKKGHQPVDIHGNLLLEIVWIVIPTLLVLSMFYYGYTGFREIRDVPEDAYIIKVQARMWQWEFNYDNGKKSDTLYVPIGTPIKLELFSQDVNHSLYIPSFRIKEDAIVGRTNYLFFKPEQAGSYDIVCAEYCGLKHSMMYSKVVVLPETQYTAWYNSNAPETLKAGIGN